MNRLNSILIGFTLINCEAFSQTVLWNDTFENACTSGCTTYGGWTFVSVPNGGTAGIPAGCCNFASPNGASSNVWYVSCAENGMANGVCGAGCGANESLHIGSVTLGDIGAAYDAARVTCKMAQSPVINTVAAGTATLTLSFEYIRFGDGTIDCPALLYSINSGTNWTFLANPIPIVTCCTGACSGQDQGVWTTVNYTLPATCNNIATLKIGFNWKNNGSAGADPSFAVNDVRITYNPVLPVELLSFNGYKKQNKVNLQWQTASERNNAFFEIERSTDGIDFKKIGKVNGRGTTSQMFTYDFIDSEPPLKAYYRLKQVDFDGNMSFSQVICVSGENEIADIKAFFHKDELNVTLQAKNDEDVTIQLLDMTGKFLLNKTYGANKGRNDYIVNIADLSPGTYLVYIKDKNGSKYSCSAKVVKAEL